MHKFLTRSFLVMTVTATTAWGSFAVYCGDSRTGWLQVAVAAVVVLLGVAAAIGAIGSGWRSRWVWGQFLLFSAILIWWLSIAPSNDRVWQADVSRLPYATFAGNVVTLHNIRNFTYRSEFDYQPAYYDKSYDLNKLEGVDLLSFYWMGPAIAHTILSFNFGDQGYVAVSIETRKELHEQYSTVKGFFRQYELIYIVADERDAVRLRTNYRNNPPEDAYLYRIKGPKEDAKRLFLEYLKQINALRDKPQFYNTLLDNCTTAIWVRSLVNTGHLPFSWKILLSGYLPEYLYESQRLDHRVAFAELQQQAHINSLAKAADQVPDFSERIRALNQPRQSMSADRLR